MAGFFIIILVLGLGVVTYHILPKRATLFIRLMQSVKGSGKTAADDKLKCRAAASIEDKADSSPVLNVDILGAISAGKGSGRLIAQITFADVTDGSKNIKPVKDRYNKQKTSFTCDADLGRAPGGEFVLSRWTNIAGINTDSFIVAKKGVRKLRLNVSISAQSSNDKIASAAYDFDFEEVRAGYEDYLQNSHRAKTLAIALGFAVSAADGKIYNCQVRFIKQWAANSFELESASKRTKRKFQKSLEKTFQFFRDGGHLDIFRICSELADIAPVAERLSILGFCLEVVAATGEAVTAEIKLLNEIANLLQIDRQRFQRMMQKILPVTIHKNKNVESVLGLGDDMSREETNELLTKEYSKWNARVTNSDPEIRRQADLMLSLIAGAKNEYVTAGI